MAPQEIVFAQFGRVEWMMMLVDAPNRWQRSVSSNMEKLFPHPRSHPSALFPSRGSFGYDRATAIQGAILPIHCYVYLAVPQEAQAATATTGGNNGFDYWGWLGMERVMTFVLRSLRSWYRWSCTAQCNPVSGWILLLAACLVIHNWGSAAYQPFGFDAYFVRPGRNTGNLPITIVMLIIVLVVG